MQWSDLTNSNDYRRGYEKGLKDAIDGKDKNYSGMGASLKFAIHGDHALNTYTQGYDIGFVDGIRKKNQVFVTEHKIPLSNPTNINPKNISSMTSQTSFAYQIELAEDLKSYLHGFQERLAIVAKQYENKINSLHAGGMMNETFVSFLESYFEPTKGKIQDLIDQINDSDIPFVDGYIDYLEDNPR